MSEKYTMKEHMAAHHAGAAEHHTAMAKIAQDMAGHHADLAVAHGEAGEEDLSACHKCLAKSHKAAAAEHTKEAARHSEMQKMAAGIQKSVMDQLAANRGFGLDGISGIIPAAPRAIVRNGQPDISKVEVDPAFEEMLKID